uniref:Uncharacterized protein n=1 Tax=Desertifilum tharense IPPAS B-1220 TaxID=1781255 RepID=A0ACD5GN99_9CYAN
MRSEIIVEARSPVDGRLLTPAQYVQLQAELAVSPPNRSRRSPRLNLPPALAPPDPYRHPLPLKELVFAQTDAPNTVRK